MAELCQAFSHQFEAFFTKLFTTNEKKQSKQF